jgi:hypothetical protein
MPQAGHRRGERPGRWHRRHHAARDGHPHRLGSARFGFVFSQRGIVPEAASSWFLPRLVGISQALEWCYSGRVFPAQEALAGRLVSKVVPPEELLPTARALAKTFIDKTAPVSVALIRQMMWRMMGADDPMEAHKIDSRGIYARGRSEDVKEGVNVVPIVTCATGIDQIWPVTKSPKIYSPCSDSSGPR